jgi:3-deoxy-D-manno-octulosonic-acid transferase
MAASLVRLFRLIVTQDPETVARLIAMGADPGRVREGGNLKTLIPVPGCDARAVAALREMLAGRRVWLAASTHAPEEDAVAEAHRIAAVAVSGVLTILAPRHPEQGDEIAARLAGQGLTVARRSRGEIPEAETDVWLADTLGEMGLWLRLVGIAFIGGSIAPQGGHNPFEPAALGVAILHGPEIASFAPAYGALDKAGATRTVADGEQMGSVVVELMGSEAARVVMIDAAEAVRQRLEPDIAALTREVLALMETGP